MIDFWGAGYTVAEKMGMVDALEKVCYKIPYLEFVDKESKIKGRMNVQAMRKAVDYRHYNLLRTDLAKILYEKVKDNVPFIFDNTIASLKETPEGVSVTFSDGTTAQFDLVIGADGLRSNVRQRMFSEENGSAEHFMGYYVSSFTIDNDKKKEGLFLSHAANGKQLTLYSVAENKLAAFFIFRQATPLTYDYKSREAQEAVLRNAFQDMEWECPDVLAKIDTAPDFYLDSVSQIKLDHWSKGRVALVGDAAYCLSLLSGQGSAWAMTGAYTLAGELKMSGGEYQKAFAAYEHRLHEEILRKQRNAQRFAGSFVPGSDAGVFIRNTVSNMMFLPGISQLFIHLFLTDKDILGDYS